VYVVHGEDANNTTQYPLYNIFYNIFFHPLANFPGPWTWGSSRLPFVRSLIKGTIVHDIERLHRRYGPILRIAPNEITFAKLEAWTDIFQGRSGHLQFPKDPVWWARQPGQSESLLSAGFADHSRMRKLLSHGFTKRALKSQEPIIQSYVSLLIERLQEQINVKSEGAVIDIVPVSSLSLRELSCSIILYSSLSYLARIIILIEVS